MQSVEEALLSTEIFKEGDEGPFSACVTDPKTRERMTALVGGNHLIGPT